MNKTNQRGLYHRAAALLLTAALPTTLLLTHSPGCVDSNPNPDPFDREGNPANAGKEYMRMAPAEDCFWIASISTGDGWNVFYPGPSMSYPLSGFDVPDGAELRFEGEFPHTRFFSFTMYYPGLGASTGIGGSQTLVDTAIEPDPGSVNPFLDGADRNADNRKFTVYFQEGDLPPDPADREPNTIYLGPEFPIQQLRHAMGMRVYLPDMDTNAVGGVELATPVLTLADGTELRGADACPMLTGSFAGRVPVFPSLGFDQAAYRAARDNRALYPNTHPAQNPPVWNRVWSQTYNFCITFTPEEDCGPAPTATAIGPGGFGNPANGYLETWVDRKHGEVLVLRGKKPITPTTYFGDAPADTGEEMRFFSISSTESQYTWSQIDDVFDEEIPVDEDGFYTVVISRPYQRPVNANYSCGVAWMEFPPGGDGFGDNHLARVVMRETGPKDSFANSVTNVMERGAEAEVMGDHYPHGEYMSKQDFESRYGCP